MPPTWTPRNILDRWTPDQARVAACFPACRRVCVPAANGVGKTFLAADLVVSFMKDMPEATVILTAPTNRQVCELLWPHVAERMVFEHLAEQSWTIPATPKWSGEDGDRLIGFATNSPQRMQGFHAEHLLIVMDEASGMPQSLVEALEGIAVSERNYILAIGNPNTADGAFYQMTKLPSWRTETISALTHPNILERREKIPGATTWISMVDRIRDWCKPAEEETAETFRVEISDRELGIGVCEERTPRFFTPNDAFRVRYLGRFPHAVQWALIDWTAIHRAMDATPTASRPRLAAVDVARTGGDRTVYGLRVGDTLARIRVVGAGTFEEQALEIAGLLEEDRPEMVTVDAAGLGVGLVEALMKKTPVQVVPFLGADPPTAPSLQKRYFNRRAAAYGNLAEAFSYGRIGLPREPALADELAAMRYQHTADGRMLMLPKDEIRRTLGRSPDMADMLSLLWESAACTDTGPMVRPARKKEDPW